MKSVGVVTLAKEQGFYPGSAPLIRGKDLLPASILLLLIDLDYKDPAPTTQEPATSLWWFGFFSRARSLLVELRPPNLRSRTPLIKVAGSWTYTLYRVLLIHGVLLWALSFQTRTPGCT